MKKIHSLRQNNWNLPRTYRLLYFIPYFTKRAKNPSWTHAKLANLWWLSFQTCMTKAYPFFILLLFLTCSQCNLEDSDRADLLAASSGHNLKCGEIQSGGGSLTCGCVGVDEVLVKSDEQANPAPVANDITAGDGKQVSKKKTIDFSNEIYKQKHIPAYQKLSVCIDHKNPSSCIAL